MKRITVRLLDQVHTALNAELADWRKLRGPRFSLNDMCSEKLCAPIQITAWPQTCTSGTGTASTWLISSLASATPQTMVGGKKQKK